MYIGCAHRGFFSCNKVGGEMVIMGGLFYLSPIQMSDFVDIIN